MSQSAQSIDHVQADLPLSELIAEAGCKIEDPINVRRFTKENFPLVDPPTRPDQLRVVNMWDYGWGEPGDPPFDTTRIEALFEAHRHTNIYDLLAYAKAHPRGEDRRDNVIALDSSIHRLEICGARVVPFMSRKGGQWQLGLLDVSPDALWHVGLNVLVK